MRMKLLSKAGTVVSRASDFGAYAAGALIILLAGLIAFSIITRKAGFGHPIWAAQTAEYILLWFTFLGAAWLLRKDGHVRVDFLVDRFGPKVRRVFAVIESAIGAVTCAFIAWLGAQVTWDFWQRGVMDVRAINVPEFALMIVIPVGSLLLCLEFIRSLRSYRRGSEQQ